METILNDVAEKQEKNENDSLANKLKQKKHV